MALGSTITEYELPTPSGVEDYSCGNLKSGFWGDIRGSKPFSLGFPLKMVQNPRHPKKSRLQISTAIIFYPRESWKLIFGDCVAQGHCLKLSEPIFIFSIFLLKIFDFWKSDIRKYRKFRICIDFPNKIFFQIIPKMQLQIFWSLEQPWVPL